MRPQQAGRHLDPGTVTRRREHEARLTPIVDEHLLGGDRKPQAELLTSAPIPHYTAPDASAPAPTLAGIDPARGHQSP